MGVKAPLVKDSREDVRVLRCQECGKIVAIISDGKLIVHSRHHGIKHINEFDLLKLQEQAKVV